VSSRRQGRGPAGETSFPPRRDARDSKSRAPRGVWVPSPPPASAPVGGSRASAPLAHGRVCARRSRPEAGSAGREATRGSVSLAYQGRGPAGETSFPPRRDGCHLRKLQGVRILAYAGGCRRPSGHPPR